MMNSYLNIHGIPCVSYTCVFFFHSRITGHTEDYCDNRRLGWAFPFCSSIHLGGVVATSTKATAVAANATQRQIWGMGLRENPAGNLVLFFFQIYRFLADFPSSHFWESNSLSTIQFSQFWDAQFWLYIIDINCEMTGNSCLSNPSIPLFLYTFTCPSFYFPKLVQGYTRRTPCI